MFKNNYDKVNNNKIRLFWNKNIGVKLFTLCLLMYKYIFIIYFTTYIFFYYLYILFLKYTHIKCLKYTNYVKNNFYVCI